jgi:hypothetical protein
VITAAYDPRVPRRSLTCLLLAAVLTGCSGGSGEPAASPSPTITGVTVFPDLSHEHRLGAVSYPQQPPVGGPHWPPSGGGVRGWQQCAVYEQPVVDEFAVHSLEHGAVWLTYRPGLKATDVTTMQGLAGIRPAYVILSPYPDQPSPVMATAWGFQLSVEDPADPRLAEFVRSYAGGSQGGEPGADCAHGATVAQARAALAAAAS